MIKYFITRETPQIRQVFLQYCAHYKFTYLLTYLQWTEIG